jgi:hypothetical protein
MRCIYETCLDLGPILKVSHYVYTNAREKEWQVLGLTKERIQGQHTQEF